MTPKVPNTINIYSDIESNPFIQLFINTEYSGLAFSLDEKKMSFSFKIYKSLTNSLGKIIILDKTLSKMEVLNYYSNEYNYYLLIDGLISTLQTIERYLLLTIDGKIVGESLSNYQSYIRYKDNKIILEL
jgi:hypothetical protein